MNFTDIFEATREGTVEDVRYFIEQKGIDVNAKGENGWTPLIFTVRDNPNVEVLKYLISQKADLNAKSDSGFISLHFAAANGHIEYAKILISAGADINSKENDGLTPLHMAVLNGRTKATEFLLSTGADVNVKSNDGYTLLHSAVLSGQIEIAKVLVSAGADINVEDELKIASLVDATINAEMENITKIEIIKVLVSAGANVNSGAGIYPLPIFSAVSKPHRLEIVKTLVSAGAKVNETNINSQTPLHVAVIENNIEEDMIDVVKFLISAGADINAKTNDGATPLAIAKSMGKTAMVQCLSGIRQHAQTEEPNRKSKTKVIIIALVILGILFWFLSGNYETTAQPKEAMPLEKKKPETSTFTDSRDNKTYKTVKIGSQTWMAENLNINVSDSKCYDNNNANCDKYGRLYTWTAAKKACPAGWHLPSDADWTKLANFVGEETAGIKLRVKENNGVDEYGFAALPGGNGYKEVTFEWLGTNGYWWTDSELDAKSAYYRAMGYEIENVRSNSNYKAYFFSVRCIQ